MIAAAIRIAQRMVMQSEPNRNTPGYTALDAEMRRRLWWSLVLFDHRTCELVGQENFSTLSPTWDCCPPSSVYEFELRPRLTKTPTKHEISTTEALFVVVRSELADFLRHCSFHLEFVLGRGNLSSDMISQSKREGGELQDLEKMIEKKYLAQCNPDLPLDFITIWTTRSFLAQSHLLETFLEATNITINTTNASPAKHR